MTGFILVFLGGGAGSALRYTIGLLVRKTEMGLPLATFCANMLACLVFAIVIHVDRARPVSPQTSALLLTGFCGGLSTFSTFGYETYLLFTTGSVMAAVLNVLVSTVAALGMFYAVPR